jgi:hypothetical protein
MNDAQLAIKAKNDEIYKEAIKWEAKKFYIVRGIDKGAEKVPSVEPIAKQNFIPNTQQASEKQIYNYMKSLGFRNVFGDSYRKKTIVVHDLKPRNVLVDTDGDVYVIDAEFINTEFKIY